MNDVITAITTVGFPIVACLGCFWAFLRALKYLYDHERQDLIDTIHTIDNLTLAVEKNGEALKTLILQLNKED